MGNRNIIIPLYSQVLEEYEKSEQNLVSISVVAGQQDISTECEIIIAMSKNALIGFATEVLRIAENFEFDKAFHIHLDPLGTSYSNQSLGFFLTSNSAEIVVYFEDIGCLKDYGIEKSKSIGTYKKDSELHLDYLICKSIDNEYLEPFQLGFENIAEFNVIKNWEIINKKCTVVIKAGKFGFMGLGTEFIRLAHNYKEGVEFETIPSCDSTLGVFLTPKSSKLKLILKNLHNVYYYDQDFGSYS